MVLLFVAVVTFYFHLKEELVWILDVFLLPLYVAQALLAGLGLLWVAAALGPGAGPGAAAPGRPTLALLLGLPTGAYALRAACAEPGGPVSWPGVTPRICSVSLKPNAILAGRG